MKLKHLFIVFITITFTTFLSAYSSIDEKLNPNDHTEIKSDIDNHMNHSSSAKVPDDLKVAENPTYPVGSKAIIKADHMEGMKGAEAKIVGAYSTTAYVVSYTPTTGGEKVNNHKWVVQEEIKNADNDFLEPGTEVTLEADHMKGMKGAKATIDSGKKTTVYMINYTPTTGGEKVINHKWVTENELSPLNTGK